MKQNFFNISKKIEEASIKAMKKAQKNIERIEEITEYNQQKILSAFIKNSVSESHFVESTGYGYGDRGRDTLERVVADAFDAEDALVRHSFTCGTHTLGVALFGILRPGDTMLCVTGTPYDTIHPVIGIGGANGQGSLADFAIKYEEVALCENGTPDLKAIARRLQGEKVRMVYIQRSRGYSLRPSLHVSEIKEIIDTVRKYSDAVIMVDNCYGEFVETLEPTGVGADLMAGSLIKNAGGGLCKTGGYIAGRRDLVELCSYRMTVAGIGREVGATLGHNREMFMGIFSSPHVTGEALKTAVFTAALFEVLGFDVTPGCGEIRADIIQSVCLENEKNLVAFCRGMQSGAPVDSFVVPEASDMPGYTNKVIMAAGAFIMGASIELSADAPLREPYAAWMQGGLNFHSAKMGVMLAAQKMESEGLL